MDLIAKDYDTVITFEDGIENGGFGDVVLNHLAKINFKGKFIKKAYPDEFIQHGSIEDLEKNLGLDENSIFNFLNELNE